MTRQLTVTEIHGTICFDRTNVIQGSAEADAILTLSDHIYMMVKRVKNAENKKDYANQEVKKLLTVHQFLAVRFDNLEQSIREFARKIW